MTNDQNQFGLIIDTDKASDVIEFVKLEEGQPESHMSVSLRAEARIAEIEAQLEESDVELARKDEKLQRFALGMQRHIERAEKAEAEAARLRAALEEIAEGRYACGDDDCYAIDIAQVALDDGPEDEKTIAALKEAIKDPDVRTLSDPDCAALAEHDELRKVLNRIAAQVGHPPIAEGEVGVESVAESVERRLAYAREREAALESITPESLQAFAASEAHHDEHHEREAKLRAALEQLEWAGTATTEDALRPACPVCGRTERDGHKADCDLFLALNPDARQLALGEQPRQGEKEREDAK
jgi:DNA repair exonuclease SbcCD ATPase subunit